MNIVYYNDKIPTSKQANDLYRRCSLGERRPIDDRSRFDAMLNHANLLITAWNELELIGMARCLTDFAFITYIADLLVDERYQRQGIGIELIRQVQKSTAEECKITLLAAPQAKNYYGHIGFEQHDSAWVLNKKL